MESLPRETCTILKIKRKRTDEPLDALVIESFNKRRKSRGVSSVNGYQPPDEGEERSVFQFAETVEQSAWKDEARMEAMQDRISSMSRKVIPLKRSISRITSPTTQPDAKPSPRRYTVVSQPKEPSGPIVPKAPPQVRSARELKEEREREKANESMDTIMMYEAIPVDDDKHSKDLMLDEDPEMASFIPMLEEYLRVNDINVHDTRNGTGTSNTPTRNHDSDDEYVWDVFIHRKISLETWNQMALLGSVSGVPGDDSYPSDESEIEDEADEDSNDENWYANDYPDEEDSEDDHEDVFDSESE